MAMVTRYSIQDEVGRVLTRMGFFAYDTADAVEFRDEDDAYEELAAYPGCTVETYERPSAFPDLITTRTFSIERSAA